MAFVLLDTGALVVKVRHTTVKDGIFFYYRRIPEELQAHYGGKVFIRKSLKTRVPQVAARKVTALASADDALWASLRSPEGEELGLTRRQAREGATALLQTLGLSAGAGARDPSAAVDVLDGYLRDRYGHDYERSRNDEFVAQVAPPESFYTPVEREAVRLVMDSPHNKRVLLTDALSRYLKNHDRGEDPKFKRENERAIDHVIKAVGDLPLQAYKKEHANAVRDHLLAQGLKTTSARRELNRIKAIYNVGVDEFDLGGLKNPFENIRIAREEKDAEERAPFTREELNAISAACQRVNDDIRHIVALQADTGARLGEIVGLRIEDVVLDGDVPHLHIRFHEKLGRRLKNAASERKVPLVGII